MIGIDAVRLIAAVVESGMGEVQLCVTAGVGHQTFAKMVRGQMVRYPSIAEICKVLDLKPAEIIREIPNETLQAAGHSELVFQGRREPGKPEDNAQSVRLAAAGRAPS
jgi:DNA-binding Xre family transcriptional regulator